MNEGSSGVYKNSNINNISLLRTTHSLHNIRHYINKKQSFHQRLNRTVNDEAMAGGRTAVYRDQADLQGLPRRGQVT